jgi:hypothetical protein
VVGVIVALNADAEREQNERYLPGPWDDVIEPWINKPSQRLEEKTSCGVEPFQSEPGKVTVTDVLLHAVGKRLQDVTQTDRNSVARCMIHLKWKRWRLRDGPQLAWFYLSPERFKEFCS